MTPIADRSDGSILGIIADAARSPAFAVETASLSIVAVNDEMLSSLGRSGEDLAGHPCTDICSGPTGLCNADLGCPARAAFQSGGSQPVDLSLLTHEGEHLSHRMIGLLLPGGAAFVSSQASADTRFTSKTRESRVFVRALGEFSVTGASGQPLKPRRPQVLSLLRLLLTKRGRALPDTEALQAFWPDRSRARGLRALQVLVHELRQMLEPDLAPRGHSRFIVREAQSYQIASDAPIDLDADAFLRLAEEARALAEAEQLREAEQRARAALEVYAGDLFEPYEEAIWFAAQRRELRNVGIDLLLLRAQLLTCLGERPAAMEQVRLATEGDLLREDAQRLRMVLHAGAFGRVAASQYFMEMFAAFRRRAGLPPSRETADLAKRISDGEPLDVMERELIPLSGCVESAGDSEIEQS